MNGPSPLAPDHVAESAETKSDITLALSLRVAIDELSQRLEYFEERRASARYPFNVPLTIYVRDENGRLEEQGRAWGLNISTLGLAFLSQHPYPRNSQVCVDLKPLVGETTYTKLNVVHCSDPVDGIYRMGGYFAFDEQVW